MNKIVSVSLMFAFLVFSCGMLPQSVEKDGVKIQYTKGATKEEANQLLTYLIDNGFSDGSQKDLKLEKNGDGYIVKMVTKSSYDLDEKNLELMTDFACEMSKVAFAGKKVQLDLCDDSWGLRKSVNSDNCEQFEMLDKEKRTFGSTELLFSDNLTTAEVDAVEDYLKTELDDDVERTFAIDKKDGKAIFSMVIMNKRNYDDPESMDSFRELGCDIMNILGYETEVHLCDEYMKMEKVVKAEKCK